MQENQVITESPDVDIPGGFDRCIVNISPFPTIHVVKYDANIQNVGRKIDWAIGRGISRRTA